MHRAPDLSIVVPAFNEEKLLGESLRAVTAAATAAFGAADIGWELIVCDNNSTDRTAVIARDEGARVVFEPVNQIGRARNTGAAAASGAWLLFIDADSRPSAALLAETAALLRRSDVLLAGSAMWTDEPHFTFRLCCHVWNWASRARRLVAGSFILVRADAFREVGGFDLRFFAGEEIDFALRLRARIGRPRRLKTVILHRHPILTSARKLRLYGAREIARFMFRAVFRPMRTLSRREDCLFWYDGRR